MSSRMEAEYYRQKDALRLNKYLSEAGVCSRREADRLIEKGHVTVDGQPAEKGMRIVPGKQEICVGKKVISGRDKMTVLAVNKPAGIVCTEEKRERNSIVRFLNYPIRLTYVGRLDKETEGLLLFTDDGELGHRLTAPKHQVEKEYYAEVEGPLGQEDVAAFREGLTLRDGTRCLPAVLELCSGGCRVTVREGKYHQVRRMLASRGAPVTYLRREREGGLTLGALAPGEYRLLLPEEIDKLL